MNALDDEAEIRALITKLALIVDEGSLEDYDAVYAPDAIWETGDDTHRGIEAIRAASMRRRADGMTGPGSGGRHLVTPMRIEIEGNTAVGWTYFIFLVGTGGTPKIHAFGIYDDAFTRSSVGWRIGRRVGRNDSTSGG